MYIEKEDLTPTHEDGSCARRLIIVSHTYLSAQLDLYDWTSRV